MDKLELRFRFDKLTGYSNILMGILFIIYGGYILFTDPIRELEGDELTRLLFIVSAILYCILQIYYSITVLQKILKDNPDQTFPK